MNISATNGKVFYTVVQEAMKELEIVLHENDNKALLVWNDTIKDQDYFRSLSPHQIVNRLPLINVICRKAPFVRVIQRIAKYFRKDFRFLPKSYILPLQRDVFQNEVSKAQKKFIVKPNNGALGAGIVIVHPGDNYMPIPHLAVAQQYIESYLYDGYKFDLRIYCLVIADVKPVIYVYHDGIARFCSAPVSAGGEFSELTNTAVNIKNPHVTAESITRTVSEVFGNLAKKGVDIPTLWHNIEDAIGLTVISSASFLVNGSRIQCPSCGYPRCFQILGFDVLIDQNLKPWILEVNYRPSLEFGTAAEKELKIEMLKAVMQIAAPYAGAEAAMRGVNKTVSFGAWVKYLCQHQEIITQGRTKAKEVVSKSKFFKVFPDPGPGRENWNEIYDFAVHLSHDTGSSFGLPRDTANPPKNGNPLTSSKEVINEVIKEEPKEQKDSKEAKSAKSDTKSAVENSRVRASSPQSKTKPKEIKDLKELKEPQTPAHQGAPGFAKGYPRRRLSNEEPFQRNVSASVIVKPSGSKRGPSPPVSSGGTGTNMSPVSKSTAHPPKKEKLSNGSVFLYRPKISTKRVII